MIINEDAVLIPTKGNIVVEINPDTVDQKDGFWATDELFDYIDENGVLVYTATVVAVSPEDAGSVVIGDKVMFNSMAGSHLATKDSLKKVIPVKNSLVKIDSMSSVMVPLFDRVLVEILEEDDGAAVVAATEDKDPRLTAMMYAKVLAVGEGTSGELSEGDIVGIEYSVGEIVKRKGVGQPEVRAMSELYISVIIKQ